MLNSPEKATCYGCEDRHVGCHAKCERYAKWRSALDEYKDNVRKKKEPDEIAKAYIHARHT